MTAKGGSLVILNGKRRKGTVIRYLSTCRYIYIFSYLRVLNKCIEVHVCTHICTHIGACMYTYIYTYIYIYMYTYMYTYIYTYMYTYKCTYIYTCMYTYLYTYMSILEDEREQRRKHYYEFIHIYI
jgi:hypothetical protein